MPEPNCMAMGTLVPFLWTLVFLHVKSLSSSPTLSFQNPCPPLIAAVSYSFGELKKHVPPTCTLFNYFIRDWGVPCGPQAHDLALLQLWYRSQLRHRLDLWPRNFHMLQGWSKKKKKSAEESVTFDWTLAHHFLIILKTFHTNYSTVLKSTVWEFLLWYNEIGSVLRVLGHRFNPQPGTVG